MDNTTEQVKLQVEKITQLVEAHENWVIDAPVLQNIELLLNELSILESLQPTFQIVDQEVRFFVHL